MAAEDYVRRVVALINEVVGRQSERIRTAAEIIAATILNGGRIWAFGATHSSIMVQELVYRAGGLIPINPLFAPGLDVSVRPVTLSSKMERLPGYGRILVSENGVRAGDCVIVFSASGRNPVPIDVALAAKEAGAKVIGFVSESYARAVPSRHPAKKNLLELDLDLVIDNGAPVGDALVEVSGNKETVYVGPMSTITSCVLVNAIVVETASILAKQVDEIPVFLSGNLENGDEHNARLLELYKDRLTYL